MELVCIAWERTERLEDSNSRAMNHVDTPSEISGFRFLRSIDLAIVWRWGQRKDEAEAEAFRRERRLLHPLRFSTRPGRT